MLRKIIVSILFITTIVFSLFSAQNHSGKIKPGKKSVLIIRDSTDLEINVSRMVNDTLSKLGYKVKEVQLADAGKEKAFQYKISIVFSAVNAGEEIDARLQNFLSTKTDASKVLLFSVYGKIFDKQNKDQNKDVDATTEASKALHPELIAEQILRSLKL